MPLMRVYSVAVVGGGASSITAAISAARGGAGTVICEKMPNLGKKILISGNGRCNLLNETLNESFYNKNARLFVKTVFSRFGKSNILDFFKDLGLEVYSQDGRIFPATNQSSSVLKVLETELKSLSVQIESNFDVAVIAHSEEGFTITATSGRKVMARTVILAAGGKTFPASGSCGDAYKLSKAFGHSTTEPVPAAVPLLTKDPVCHILQGQKITASAKSIIDGKVTRESSGDVLFTKYGLSGTAILDISEDISIAINRHNKRNVIVSVDMAPFMPKERLREELKKRVSKKYDYEELIMGILPNKFGNVIKEAYKTGDLEDIAAIIKDKRFKVTGTRGWNEADFTSGGIDIKDVDERTLESRLIKGLYFAGEELDVTGKRGGYNLGWAWASGSIAGKEAACAG